MEGEKIISENPQESSEDELPYSDKLIGMITTPAKTMEQISKYPLKPMTWLTPLIIFIVISGLATFLYSSNPALKAEMETKSREAIEKSYNERVEKGDMTQEEADEEMEKVMTQMEKNAGSTMTFQFIGIAIYTFIAFFLINLIYFALIRFILKGEGGFGNCLTAYGLSYYILIIQTIITIILSLAFDKFYMSISLANIIETDWTSFSGFLLRKADPFLIWFYVVLGIAYAKMFNSDDTKKYVILTLAVWILGNLFLYYMSTVSQIFSGFAM